jgi:hypothetical protein
MVRAPRPFILLEIEFRLHIAQKDQDLQRLHIRTGGDHVHGDGDAGIIVVAERPDQRLGVGAIGLVGDLLGKVVTLAEHLADDACDLFRVVIVLRED